MSEKIPTRTFHTGNHIPVLGFGTWGLEEGKEEQAVAWALETGYRHIDTAKIYGSEEAVGRAVAASDVPREDLFITTKLWNADQGYESALRAIDESLKTLQMEYIDLYLIHWPFTDETEGENRREETWRAMEQIRASGKARDVGVSNFLRTHIEEMKEYATILPAVNQIEFHPFWFRNELMEYCHHNDIVVVNYSPLTRGEEIDNPLIREIARSYEKTPAQVLLRWGIQHGNVVIPKSSNREHIAENLRLFDFELSQEDMDTLDGLNENRSILGTQFA